MDVSAGFDRLPVAPSRSIIIVYRQVLPSFPAAGLDTRLVELQGDSVEPQAFLSQRLEATRMQRNQTLHWFSL